MRRLVAALALGALATLTPAQVGIGEMTTSREEMWYAPTAEDWAKPVLIKWQRTWEDALAVSRETGRPILACVNMDGEIASEHYAGIRYRDPESAALFEPYVCVIASVYRHNPRDYDEEGRRIECPRFGTVTCGEHIAIEPILYERFLDETRVAPRHIAIELDGSEMYDVYYAFDTKSVFALIREGGEGYSAPVVRGDRPLLERVESRDVRDREFVEAAYADGDAALRQAVLDAVAATGEEASVDLLRLAIYGLDTELAARARAALAVADSDKAIDLIVEALRVPLEPGERDRLVSALERHGEDTPRARTLAVVHRGLGSGSSAVGVDGWAAALAAAEYEAAAAEGGADAVAARLEEQNAILESDDAQAHLELAESFLEQAYEVFETDAEHARYLFEDARRTARRAEELGATGWRVDAAASIAAYYLDDRQTAHARAEAAMAEGLPDDADGWNAMAVLAIFAQARQLAITDAVRAGREWPPEWLADLDAAYGVLASHPYGTPEQVVAHYDFLNWLTAAGRSRHVLERGLERFPDSWALHERLRQRVLWESGADRLEPTYEARLAEPDAPRSLSFFAGIASIEAAEHARRAGRDTAALAAYGRALEHLDRDRELNPELSGEADHWAALALGGRARVQYERGDDDATLAALLASFERSPDSAAARDGLNISTVDTAKMLRARLRERERDALLAKLDAALDALDPALLRLPEFERGGPRPPGVAPDAPQRRRPGGRPGADDPAGR